MKSVIALSMHKAGSTVANAILTQICTARGYAINDIAQAAWTSGQPVPEAQIAAQAQMPVEDHYFGIVRAPILDQMPRLRQMRVVILVRDPRDCITSNYFSIGWSHSTPANPEAKANFEAERARVRARMLDGYATDVAADWAARMRQLADLAESHPDALVLTYEDMVGQTEAFLTRLTRFVGQSLTPALRQQIAKTAEFDVSHEDQSRHKRQVAPGDHRRKLRPETVAQITQTLRPQMVRFGYRDNGWSGLPGPAALRPMSAQLTARVNPEFVCGPHTDLTIEGYPRSANTFAVDTLTMLAERTGRSLRIAHHTHDPENLLLALARGVPGILLIRSPHAAIASFCLYSKAPLTRAIRRYEAFYETLLPYRDALMVAPFDAIVADPNTLVAAANAHFDLALPISPDPISDMPAIQARETARAALAYSTEDYPYRVAVPTAARRQSLRDVADQVKERLAKQPRAEDLYHAFLT